MNSTKLLAAGVAIFGVCVIGSSAASQTSTTAEHDSEDRAAGPAGLADSVKFEQQPARIDRETLDYYEHLVSSDTAGTWAKDFTPVSADHGYPGNRETLREDYDWVPREWLETY